ncbi:anhydro-N-acetylmuramic acid kinase [Pustulibacterium marinum]|uniref:Anhydro-N-acetylmuramic acid kinase n=1 Tax=Pustulibacterium marinum TaxID=1224947 RepID=A0A1I7F4E6_9FLAO|nr:anhydro-N-acetylmuramic acid kinase [Pustulibacterium marinum]SFU30985.1 anhydro-N-acetylmuramic acid kinase [Pustulibacterium marinum]
MENINYKVVGVMSGTSLDGVDLVYCEIYEDATWKFNIYEARTYAYSSLWKSKLENAISLAAEELEELDIAYTKYLSEVINQFKSEFSLNDIDAVCSHGHTVFHEPHNGITKQIGNRPELASLINELVVCNFRVQDVELGGQGAPLVPIGDQLLFSNFDFCLNLGGFANVSYQENEIRIAFDICPVNIVMNVFARQLGEEYDKGGAIARTGKIHEELLNELNQLSYYQKTPPKSLGLEWVKAEVLPIIQKFTLVEKDVLRTFVEHVAIQLSEVIQPNKTVLVTGGGAYHSFLMERTEKLAGVSIELPENELVEFKEALIFAFLGVLRMCNKVNCLKSVTGAKHDHSSGYIYKP